MQIKLDLWILSSPGDFWRVETWMRPAASSEQPASSSGQRVHVPPNAPCLAPAAGAPGTPPTCRAAMRFLAALSLACASRRPTSSA